MQITSAENKFDFDFDLFLEIVALWKFELDVNKSDKKKS